MTDRKIKILSAVITSLILFAASVTQIFINDSAGISVFADDTYETFSDGSAYMIKNVNSGMYIDVTGGKAEKAIAH